MIAGVLRGDEELRDEAGDFAVGGAADPGGVEAQSLDFLREQAGAVDPAVNALAVPAVILVTLTLWTLAGCRHAGQPRRGALAGLRSAALTTLTLWAAMLLSDNPRIG